MSNSKTNPGRKNSTYICNAVTLDNWIGILIKALIPPFCAGTWAIGLHSFIFSSQDLVLLKEFYQATLNLSNYIRFCSQIFRSLHIIGLGLLCLIPIALTSCFFSFLTDWIGSRLRKKPQSLWWLVTGLLFALVMPPTIPLWMVAFGITIGTIFGKEVFGGDGMNVFNPALISRCFLVLSFPGNFSGDVWISPDAYSVQRSIQAMIQQKDTMLMSDIISASSPLGQLTITKEVRQIHLELLILHLRPNQHVPSQELKTAFEKWGKRFQISTNLALLTNRQLESFLTFSREKDGLGLKKELFIPAMHMAKLYLGEPPYTAFGLLIGIRPGCCGEVGIIGSLLGACVLLWHRIASGLIMLSILVGSVLTLCLFKWTSSFQNNPFELYAKYAIPIHMHLMMGGLIFGTVFMATDPVSSPSGKHAKVLYGLLIGFLVILVRLKSNAFKEGVMFSILIGNVFAPLLDQLSLELHFINKNFWRKKACNKKI